MPAQRISQLAAAAALAGTELIEVSQLSTTVTLTAVDLSALAADNSINSVAGAFVTAGFVVGMAVKVAGFTGNVANNIVSGVLTAVTAGKLTIGGTDGDVIVDDAAGESVTITAWVSKRSTPQAVAEYAVQAVNKTRGTGLLTVGAISTITDDTKYNSFPLVRRMASGSLLATYFKGDNHNADNTGNIVRKVSADEGATWGAETTVFDDPTLACINVGLCVKRYAPNAGRILSLFTRRNAPSDPLDGAHVTYSDDNAATWSAAVNINSALTSYTYASGGPTELSNGDLLVCVEGKNTGDTFSRLKVLKSTDGGATWGSEVEVDPTQVRHGYEGQMCQLDDERVLMLIRATDGVGDIYKSYSSNRGATWSAPSVAFAGHGQPNVIQLRSRTLFAVTRANDGLAQGDVYAYTSTDRGATWSMAVNLDTTPYEMEYGCPVETLTDGLVLVVYGHQPTSATTNSDLKQVYATETMVNLSLGPLQCIAIAIGDETTALTVGVAKVTFRVPFDFLLAGDKVKSSVNTAPTGATVIVDINVSGSTILSTKLSIDATEKTSKTAAAPAVLTTDFLADDAEVTIDIDQVGSTIAGAGAKVYLIGRAVE